MPIDHYENFPVASLLLPRHLQDAVGQVYWFARSADDLADEGDASPDERLAALGEYDAQLDRLAAKEPLSKACASDRFLRLGRLIASWPLSFQPFHDLLSAFMQDVTTTRYENYDRVLDYCRRSANPVGRLMLQLYRADDPEKQRQSDAICTALQLINFWQDVAIDAKKGRIYVPLEDLRRFAVSEDALFDGRMDKNWVALMRFQCDRARMLMVSGSPLVHGLPGRIGLELRLVVQGGLRILEKIEGVHFDIFTRRPTLTRSDWPLLVLRALTMRRRA